MRKVPPNVVLITGLMVLALNSVLSFFFRMPALSDFLLGLSVAFLLAGVVLLGRARRKRL